MSRLEEFGLGATYKDIDGNQHNAISAMGGSRDERAAQQLPPDERPVRPVNKATIASFPQDGASIAARSARGQDLSRARAKRLGVSDEELAEEKRWSMRD